MKLKLRLNKESLSLVLVLVTLLINISQNLSVHFVWLFVLILGTIYEKKGHVLNNWFIWMSVLFEAILILSYAWAIKVPLTSTGARSILIEYSTILLVMLIISYRFSNGEYIQKVLKIVVLSILLYCAYVFKETPISDWGRVYIGDTIGIGKNAVGMRCAWGVIFAFYLAKTSSKRLLYAISLIIFAVFVAFTGSRKAVLVAVIGIAGLQLFCGGIRKLPRNIIIGVLVVSVALYYIYNNTVLYELIGNRLESTFDAIFREGAGDGSMQERTFYKLQAMKMFSDKPLIGYGINGFMVHLQQIGYFRVAYSHCNYTELLANYGLLGFLTFYIPRLYLVLKMYFSKMYRNNVLFSMIFLTMIIELIMDYEMVSYYNISSQFIFCIASPVILKHHIPVYEMISSRGLKNVDQKSVN